MEIWISPTTTTTPRIFLSTVFAVLEASCRKFVDEGVFEKFQDDFIVVRGDDGNFCSWSVTLKNRWFGKRSQALSSRIFTEAIPRESQRSWTPNQFHLVNVKLQRRSEILFPPSRCLGNVNKAADWDMSKWELIDGVAIACRFEWGWQKRRKSHKFPCELVCLASLLPFFLCNLNAQARIPRDSS